MPVESADEQQKKLFKKICRKVGVTLRDHQMLQPDDHILLGISGGKDSMVMLEVMAERRLALPFSLQLSAAHIHVKDVGFRAVSDEIGTLCKDLGIEYLSREISIDEHEGKRKGICFLCSWQRRKALFDLTLELKCNKLALGHHRKDAVETLLMNMIYHGSMSSLPYRLSMFEGRMELIRPMLDMDENLIADYVSTRSFQTEGERCSHESENKREEIRKLINQIENLHGKGPYNMFHSMNRIFEEYLPQKKARTS
jgi:tRNA(Ile)-lysidine synthase TilS/MesJ